MTGEEKLTCYYIGAIQYAWKKGIPWRTDVDKLLRPLGVEGFNPVTVEERLFVQQFRRAISLEEVGVKRDSWKRTDKWKQFHEEHMWPIRIADIAYGVLGSDFVILYWQIGVEKGGTLDELFCAAKVGIRVFVVINQPIHTMNDWVLDVLGQMEKEGYPSYIREIMGTGLTKFAKIFRSFRALAIHVANHRDQLLERKRILRETGILELRRQLAPIFLFPGALFDYIWTTREQYREWLESRPDYRIDGHPLLDEIFATEPPMPGGSKKAKIRKKTQPRK